MKLIKNIIKEILGIFYYPILTKFAIEKYNKEIKDLKSLEEYLDFAYKFQVGMPIQNLNVNIKPQQVRDEILGLLKILYNMKPKTICEIGTASGGTLFLFTRIACSDAKIFSIDLARGNFGAGYPSCKIPFYKNFVKDNQKIHILREDSHQQETLEKLKKLLAGKRFDFLFIDGDHTYEGVKKDFEMYAPLVKKGGILALHDIALHPFETGSEVNKFWQENKNNFKYSEIIYNQKQGWAGIGVIYKL